MKVRKNRKKKREKKAW